MIIAISADSILARVYAQTALNYTMSPSSRPPLCADSSDALREIARSAAAELSIIMLPIIDDIDLSSPDDPEMISFIISEICTINPIELRLLIEQIIVTILLAQVYSEADPEASAAYTLQAEKAKRRLRALIAPASTLAITPHP